MNKNTRIVTDRSMDLFGLFCCLFQQQQQCEIKVKAIFISSHNNQGEFLKTGALIGPKIQKKTKKNLTFVFGSILLLLIIILKSTRGGGFYNIYVGRYINRMQVFQGTLLYLAEESLHLDYLVFCFHHPMFCMYLIIVVCMLQQQFFSFFFNFKKWRYVLWQWSLRSTMIQNVK